MAEAVANVLPNDGRIHSTVFHKKDSRLQDILRRHKKSDIIKLYDVECMMLFHVERADVEFDMLCNHRPYLRLLGNVDGVFLEEKTGLMFPNRCDQLDFRPDYKVESCVNYDLSDVEVATLSANGLHNEDYMLQGRVIGATLEIPCKIDYYAIMKTPITFIEIQERLSMRTSTRKTGYRTLVASFLPYDQQKHNLEDHPTLIKPEIKDVRSSIRQRELYDTKVVGFPEGPTSRTMETGADFIEVAQNRIKQKLQVAMQAGDVMGVAPKKDAEDQVNQIVETIKTQQDMAKSQAMAGFEGDTSRVDNVALDMRLNDMANRMVYAGAEAIPVKVTSITDKPLVEPKPVNKNDVTLERPTTKVESTVGSDPIPEDQVAEVIETKSGDIKENIYDAEKVADDITKKLSRKKALMARKTERANRTKAIQENAINAAKDEASTDLTKRDANSNSSVTEVKDGDRLKSIDTSTAGPNTKKLVNELSDDIIAGNVDIDAIIKSVEKQ